MCIIIDANVASEIVEPSSEDAGPVIASISSGRLKVISGHKMKEELLNCKFRRLYKVLLQAGRLVEFADNAIDDELDAIEPARLQSNDAHIIALARVSGARVLFSKDQNLHQDFTNPLLLSNPRGKVYQCREHEHLLNNRRACSC
jgi:predicted nucleic acid-binding protein